jgi:transcriptional regulator with XRE-family HTH domain
MKFPNLEWAIDQQRFAHYEVAAEADMSPSTFSRCLSGRVEFSAEERGKIASLLGYPATWLFQEIVPPVIKNTQRIRDGIELQPQPA